MSYIQRINEEARKRQRRNKIAAWVAGIIGVPAIVFGIMQIEFPEYVHPCEGLVATEEMIALVNQGVEVDVPGRNGAECELSPVGTWSLDD